LCEKRSGSSVAAGSLGTGIQSSGGGSPIRAAACLLICAEAVTATPATPIVGLSVGFAGGRQLTPDQHHGLSPRRRQIMCKMEPAPFPTECALHIAANRECSWISQAHAPDRPVSSKSRRPRKAEPRVLFRPQKWVLTAERPKPRGNYQNKSKGKR
jgi:hypothetical protein